MRWAGFLVTLTVSLLTIAMATYHRSPWRFYAAVESVAQRAINRLERICDYAHMHCCDECDTHGEGELW